jgi:hypothetical protein
MAPRYEIARTTEAPQLDGDLDRPPWNRATPGGVDWYHPAGSGHTPRVRFRLLSDPGNLWVRYTVEDRSVRCLHTEFQAPVFQDSCCEIFLEPPGAGGYFNVEINAIGAMMVSCITDPVRTPDGFAGQTMLGPEADRDIERWVSLSPGANGVIDPELPGPVTWELGVRIPYALLEEYRGGTVGLGTTSLGTVGLAGLGTTGAGIPAGTVWRGNVYKCSENSSRPHWGAWSPVGERLDFHQPARFGELVFR